MVYIQKLTSLVHRNITLPTLSHAKLPTVTSSRPCSRLNLCDAATYYVNIDPYSSRRHNSSSPGGFDAPPLSASRIDASFLPAQSPVVPEGHSASTPIRLHSSPLPSAISQSHVPAQHGLSTLIHRPKIPTAFETLNEQSNESNLLPRVPQQEVSRGVNAALANSAGLLIQSAFTGDNSNNQPAPVKQDAVDLDCLSDDKILEIFLKNETVAKQFKSACASRLLQYQQELQNAYDQRLLELENYTRQWRDTTKDLWESLKEGRLAANTKQQQDALAWQGPRQMGTGFSLPLPSVASEIVDGELDGKLDKAGRVTGISARRRSGAPSPPPAVPGLCLPPFQASPAVPPFLATQLRCPEWVYDLSGYLKNPLTGAYASGSAELLATACSEALGQNFQTLLKVPGNSQLVLRVQTGQARPVYRPLCKIGIVKKSLHSQDVVIDLNSANIALFGKAFCYMKDRRELVRHELNLPVGPQSSQGGQLTRLYDFFSSQTTSQKLSVRSLPFKCPSASVLYHLEENPLYESRRLLIARPQHQDGQIFGCEVFDVGRERRTKCQEDGQYCGLPDVRQNQELY